MTEKPWEAAFLSPLNAVLLIVARINPDGETLAGLIPDLSPRWRRHLHDMDVVALAEKFGVEACNAGKIPADYKTNYSRALAAIRPAQKLLEGWFAKDQIGTIAGVTRVAALDCMRREIDYEHSALVRNGVPPLQDIAFERADIERLCTGQPRKGQVASRQPHELQAGGDISDDALRRALENLLEQQPALGAKKCYEALKKLGATRARVRNIYKALRPGAAPGRPRSYPQQ